MASYYCDVRVISRSSGGSAVAKVAYTTRSQMTDERTGVTHDYRHHDDTSRRGRSAVDMAAHAAGVDLTDERAGKVHSYGDKIGVAHAEILLPPGAPPEFQNRSYLWNSLEGAEKRRDAQVCREVIAALPRELSLEQNIALARDICTDQFASRGMPCDFAVHVGVASDGLPQPHMHAVLGLRTIDGNGIARTKDRSWNRKALVHEIRAGIARETNKALEAAGREERVSHLSYKARGIDLEPGIKVGPAASRKGEASARVQHNRGVARRNGDRLIASPEIALAALKASRESAEVFAKRHSADETQYRQVMDAIIKAFEIERTHALVTKVGLAMRERERLASKARKTAPALPPLDPKTRAEVEKLRDEMQLEKLQETKRTRIDRDRLKLWDRHGSEVKHLRQQHERDMAKLRQPRGFFAEAVAKVKGQGRDQEMRELAHRQAAEMGELQSRHAIERSDFERKADEIWRRLQQERKPKARAADTGRERGAAKEITTPQMDRGAAVAIKAIARLKQQRERERDSGRGL